MAAPADESEITETIDPDDDYILTWKDKMKIFSKTYWRGIVCVIAPIILIAVLCPFPPQKYQWCAYTLLIMAVYWVIECIPLAVTSFLPIFIFPLVGVMSTRTTCLCYMNDTILMFLGSLMLAASVEQSGLHKRIALCAIRAIGYSHYRLLFTISFITMFISMWITNTAATSLMVPIIFGVLRVFEDQGLLNVFVLDENGEETSSDITLCYFCAATYSATIGGIGTLVGTATNLVFKGLFTGFYPEAPEYLSFPLFSAFTIPYMLLLEICLYFYMLVQFFGFLRPKSKAAQNSKISGEGLAAAKSVVNENWRALGRISMWEILVIICFCGAMLLFFSRSPQMFPGWGDRLTQLFKMKSNGILDSAAAILVVFLMLLLPYSCGIFKNFTAKTHGELTDGPIRSVLDWDLTDSTIPYSFMFLLGGGFALSEAAKKDYTDLNGRISDVLKSLDSFPNYLTILILIILTILITNFASNVAVCNVITPIAMTLGALIGVHPLWYNIATGFSASYCFCLPVGTPGNLVAQGAAKIPTGKMIKAGFIPTLFTILITWLCICFWAPVIWPDLHNPKILEAL